MIRQPFTLIILTVSLLAFAGGMVDAQERIVITGAGLLGEVVDDYATAFKADHPKCNTVVIGATSGKGFENLTEGMCQIAMVTRKITDEEKDQTAKKGIVLRESLVGVISLVVVTNAKNPVNELTIDQLRKIFTGEWKSWNQCGGPDHPIRVTMRAVPETGAGVEFQRLVLEGASYCPEAAVMSLYKGIQLRRVARPWPSGTSPPPRRSSVISHDTVSKPSVSGKTLLPTRLSRLKEL